MPAVLSIAFLILGSLAMAAVLVAVVVRLTTGGKHG